MNQREIGSKYEHIAGRYLEQKGYRILEYNYHCRRGEIDLIAQDGEYLVFCEVKYRRGRMTGSPVEAVDVYKQRKLWKTAEYYLLRHRLYNVPCRFDVIGIEDSKITLIKNAFEENSLF
ncbi:YraN family protein [Mediterraneibacter agrestimuris]|uniref:YraN family protein n=1 Tax=Mediterraneibacter agrestimuris TaxID=2941333 RepID=UPI00203B3455|nr:YraN family protein [Mediterraneibacter agrestimuris]